MTTTELPDQSDLPVQRRRSADADWSFLTKPKWILSHLFAVTMIVIFIVAMFWQLNRRSERIDQNALIADRAEATPLSIVAALQSGNPVEVDYRSVVDAGTWIDTDVVRVANRSQNGVAGEWVVGLFQTESGVSVLVNRGFVELGRTVEEPLTEASTLSGWMRVTREQEGLTAEDTGEGSLVPRLNVVAIGERLDGVSVVPMWLQLEGPTGSGAPNPVPLPDQSNGPHLSYAGQWLVFALLGTLVYGLLMRRIATSY